jgi:hypothetical protein
LSIWLKRLAIVVAVLFVGSQFVRPSKTNPPLNERLEINAAESLPSDVEATLGRSCNDCHSHRTAWPWYSNVPPASWLLAHDVNEGRSEMNFSQWGTYSEERRADLLRGICREVSDREMPPFTYAVAHPVASLSETDVQTTCAWTRASVMVSSR